MKLIKRSDLAWVKNRLMPYLELERLEIGEDLEKQGKYPDIWCEPGKNLVVVTREWARQDKDERLKRLVHECLHISRGLKHGPKERRMGYYSRPERDSYSMRIYKSVK